MIQVVEATFEDGVFRPDRPLEMLSPTRVRLVVEPLDSVQQTISQHAWETARRLWQQAAISSQGHHLTREQLHDRR
jgi:predicted DNA-binding antitoxin AbrB/MazE fold protein